MHCTRGRSRKFSRGSVQDIIFLQTFLYDFRFQFNSFWCNPDAQPNFAQVRGLQQKFKSFVFKNELLMLGYSATGATQA